MGSTSDCCGSTEKDKTWLKALEDNGAKYMGYLARLMQSRPILKRVPDNTLIIAGTGIATKAEGYAFVYLPKGGEITIDLSKISNNKVKVWWYNPRTGKSFTDGVFSNTHIFTTSDKDMVLVLDDVTKNYPVPGTGYIQPKE